MNNHVIRGSNDRQLLLIVSHSPTPAGVNKAGVEWSVAVIASGFSKGVSKMKNVEEKEADSLAAGTTLEFEWECSIPQKWDEHPAKSDLIAAQRVEAEADYIKRMEYELDYYGLDF